MTVIKLKGFEEPTTINLCPTWESVAEISIMVLENPEASQQAILDAKTQIRHMAKIAAAAVAEQEKKS
tara:strand:- start:277 stop:480 length:204 start_codon:yes stop_codon:yes gene_type:complete